MIPDQTLRKYTVLGVEEPDMSEDTPTVRGLLVERCGIDEEWSGEGSDMDEQPTKIILCRMQ